MGCTRSLPRQTLASYLPDREVSLDKLLSKADERGELSKVLGARSSKAEGERTALMYAIDSENLASAKTLLSYYLRVLRRDPEEAMRVTRCISGRSMSMSSMSCCHGLRLKKPCHAPRLAR